MKRLGFLFLCLTFVFWLTSCAKIEISTDDTQDDTLVGEGGSDVEDAADDETPEQQEPDNITDGGDEISGPDLNDILILEGKAGEGAELASILSASYDITTLSFKEDAEKIPTGLVELADYEEIILVNVAYSDMPENFDYILHKYVDNLGGGLFTVGGSLDEDEIFHSYNREDIAVSKYFKQMLPVKVINYEPVVAVLMLVDVSNSMTWGKVNLEDILIGVEACFDALNERDYFGVFAFANEVQEISPIKSVKEKDDIRQLIDVFSKKADGGTNYIDAIKMITEAFEGVNNVDRKHVIMFTDQFPYFRDDIDNYSGIDPEIYRAWMKDDVTTMRDNEITMSVVSISGEGIYDDDIEMMNLMGGEYYSIVHESIYTDPSYDMIYEISMAVQQDIGTVAKSGTSYGNTFVPTVMEESLIFSDIDSAELPMLTGYYLTAPKKGVTAEIVGKYGDPIYAEWEYGKGNVGSFMCDLSGIWSADFIADPIGQLIILNIISSLMATEQLM